MIKKVPLFHLWLSLSDGNLYYPSEFHRVWWLPIKVIHGRLLSIIIQLFSSFESSNNVSYLRTQLQMRLLYHQISSYPIYDFVDESFVTKRMFYLLFLLEFWKWTWHNHASYSSSDSLYTKSTSRTNGLHKREGVLIFDFS